jgi:trimethylamine corrinoid protein
MSQEKILERLKAGLLSYDVETVEEAAREAIDAGIDIPGAIEVLTNTIREMGDKFGAGELWLPELMMAAETLRAGTTILTPAIPKGEGGPTPGTILIGTVKGDIHDIGKTILITMFEAAGFNVVDIGVDVSPSAFAEAAKRNKADIVGASAIMSTTLPGQRDVVEYFEAMGIREKYKIMVGGGACTGEYAEEIGADAYAEDAMEAIKIASELLNKK